MKNKLGISLPTLLTLVFTTLKLTNNIDWSWWFVLSPTIFTVGLWVLMTLALDLMESIQKKGLINTIKGFL
jgi:hypothetical protein